MGYRFEADSMFRIGKSHRICQDYALHFTDGQRAVAHLSDGCSTANSRRFDREESQQVFTDMGARLMVMNAQIFSMDRPLDPKEDVHQYFIDESTFATSECNSTAIRLCLDSSISSTTLMSLRSTTTGFLAGLYGDGWVVGRRKDGWSFRVFHVEYPSGAPFYFKYFLDDGEFFDYIKKFGGIYRIHEWDWELGWELGEGVTKEMQIPMDRKETLGPIGMYFDYDMFDLVLGFSDGMGSFTRPQVTATSRENIPVSVGGVLNTIMESLKSTRGAFMSRAMDGPRGACKKFASRDWVHQDDLAIIGIAAMEDGR